MTNERFTPIKRNAMDGKTWWVVWDNQLRNFSPLVCFGKYKTKRICQFWIEYFVKEMNLGEIKFQYKSYELQF